MLPPRNKPDGAKDAKQKPDAFSRWGGQMSRQTAEFYVRKAGFRPEQQEHVKLMLRILDDPHFGPTGRRITREKFERALQEMQKNTRDRIDSRDIEKLKKAFQL